MEYKQRARRLTAIILALILVFLSADFEPFAELLSEITIIADAQEGSAATNPATGTRNSKHFKLSVIVVNYLASCNGVRYNY